VVPRHVSMTPRTCFANHLRGRERHGEKFQLVGVRRTAGVGYQRSVLSIVFSAATGFALLMSLGRSAGSVSTSLFRFKAKPASPEKTRMTPPIISQCGKPKDAIDLSGRTSEGFCPGSVCPAFDAGTEVKSVASDNDALQCGAKQDLYFQTIFCPSIVR